jgi:alpha-1,2-mannosyltransferase
LAIEGKIKFVRVTGRTLIAPKPFLTIFFQIIGTIIYTIKALILFPPDIFIDTTGLAFSFVAVKHILPKTKIGAYVHYPFVR